MWAPRVGIAALCVGTLLPSVSVVRAEPPVPAPASTATPPTPMAAAIAAAVDPFIDSRKHAGAVALVLRKGQIVATYAKGLRDVEAKLPMEKDTIFRIFSMTKIVTSVATLMLVDEGALGLDTPAENYLPELKNRQIFTGGTAEAPQLKAAVTALTIRHLLTHTAGYSYPGADDLGKVYAAKKLWDTPGGMGAFVKSLADLPLKHEPGSAWHYGINDDVLGAIIAKVSGLRLEEFFQKRIFQPLGMVDTSFDVSADKLPRLAKIYTSKDGALQPDMPPFGAFAESGRGIDEGGAGLFSTLADYSRFAQVLIGGGEFAGVRLLKAETAKAMISDELAKLSLPHHQFNTSAGWGLGVEVWQKPLSAKGDFPAIVGQFGWYGAATTYCQMDPASDTVALLFVQHAPYNQHEIFGKFQTAWINALKP